MAKKIKIRFKNNDPIEFDKGTTLKEISESFKKYFNYPIIVAKVDNYITSLTQPVNKSSYIEFLKLQIYFTVFKI